MWTQRSDRERGGDNVCVCLLLCNHCGFIVSAVIILIRKILNRASLSGLHKKPLPIQDVLVFIERRHSCIQRELVHFLPAIII